MTIKSYKFTFDKTYVHVLPNKSFLISTDMLNNYMFHIVPNDHNNPVRSINNYTLPCRWDLYYHSTIQFLLSMAELDEEQIHNKLMINHYQFVEDKYRIMSIIKDMIAKLLMHTAENNTNPDDWEYLGMVSICKQPERPLFCKKGVYSYLYKQDSIDNNIAIIPYGVLLLNQENQDNNFYYPHHEDSFMCIELPYPMVGNLINTIRIDDDGHCINDIEYYKYCQLAPMLIAPNYDLRKPIQ